MKPVFPFDLPAPTAWYAVLYILTLLLHAVFMSYVLAGSIMLGVAGLRGMLGANAKPNAWSAVTAILKDWMPFALSAAITAGIAPLLFVQVLYQREFYTANLLSFHRWMAILPVLIVAFYLLYLLKAERIRGKTAVQGIVAATVMGCILFIGWSWVENHLLSLDHASWPKRYEMQAMTYGEPRALPRLGFWIATAIPTAGILLAWQLRAGASGVAAEAARLAMRPLAWLCLISLGIAAAVAWPVLRSVLPEEIAPHAESNMRMGALVMAIGVAAQWAFWIPAVLGKVPRSVGLIIASGGSLLFWLGILIVREVARLSVVGTESLFARHARVGTTAGLGVFLVFTLIGLGTIVWIVRTVTYARNKIN